MYTYRNIFVSFRIELAVLFVTWLVCVSVSAFLYSKSLRNVSNDGYGSADQLLSSFPVLILERYLFFFKYEYLKNSPTILGRGNSSELPPRGPLGSLHASGGQGAAF